MWQAIAVVVAAGISTAVGFQLYLNTQPQHIDQSSFERWVNVLDVPLFVPFPFVSIFLLWLLASVLSKIVAPGFTGRDNPVKRWQDVARPLGFATAPGCLALLAPVPFLGMLILVASWLWGLAAQAVALGTVYHVNKLRGLAMLFAILMAASLMIGLLGVVCLLTLMAAVYSTLSASTPG